MILSFLLVFELCMVQLYVELFVYHTHCQIWKLENDPVLGFVWTLKIANYVLTKSNWYSFFLFLSFCIDFFLPTSGNLVHGLVFLRLPVVALYSHAIFSHMFFFSFIYFPITLMLTISSNFIWYWFFQWCVFFLFN